MLPCQADVRTNKLSSDDLRVLNRILRSASKDHGREKRAGDDSADHVLVIATYPDRASVRRLEGPVLDRQPAVSRATDPRGLARVDRMAAEIHGDVVGPNDEITTGASTRLIRARQVICDDQAVR